MIGGIGKGDSFIWWPNKSAMRQSPEKTGGASTKFAFFIFFSAPSHRIIMHAATRAGGR